MVSDYDDALRHSGRYDQRSEQRVDLYGADMLCRDSGCAASDFRKVFQYDQKADQGAGGSETDGGACKQGEKRIFVQYEP